MNVLYCIVESRNNIDGLWEIVVGLICVDISEAQTLLDAYTGRNFDINEYRTRECTHLEFDNALCPLIMISPRMMKEGAN